MSWEGGLVDHPSDPGGLTNHGVSLRAYPHLGREGILNLTKEEAMQIYYKDYWTPNIYEFLPESARILIFDCAVNQGSGFARKCLQRAVRATPDGIIGPETARKCKATPERQMILNIAVERSLRYAKLNIFKTFGKGWMRRLFSCFAVAMTLIKE